jgi:hypothetical protein
MKGCYFKVNVEWCLCQKVSLILDAENGQKYQEDYEQYNF